MRLRHILAAVLVLTIAVCLFCGCTSDGDTKTKCSICGGKATRTYKGHSYCKKHYDAAKLYDDMKNDWP